MMKKAFVLLSALLLITGMFTTTSMAIDLSGQIAYTCDDDPEADDLQIDRGCEQGGQSVECETSPFDFDEPAGSYCDKNADHIAVMPICNCIPDYWDEITTGDIVTVRLDVRTGPALTAETEGTWVPEDLNPLSSDQGVYWAEDVDAGIGFDRFNKDQPGDEICRSAIDYNDAVLRGDYAYAYANGTTTDSSAINTGNDCIVPDANQIVTIKPDPTALLVNSGYEITAQDTRDDLAQWVLDIPAMRADPTRVDRNLGVYVKITMFINSVGDFDDDDLCDDVQVLGCPGYIYIGRLCCDAQGSLIYPYFPPASSQYWGLIGMTLTNTSDASGPAKITIYENDGDVGVLEVDSIGAKETYLTTLADVVANAELVDSESTGSLSLGDSRSYIDVAADFNATGFAMIANPDTGESMGYLPIPEYVTNLELFE